MAKALHLIYITNHAISPGHQEMKGLITAFNYTHVTLMRMNTVATSINTKDHISRTPVMKPLPTLLVQVFGWFFVVSIKI